MTPAPDPYGPAGRLRIMPLILSLFCNQREGADAALPQFDQIQVTTGSGSDASEFCFSGFAASGG